MREGRTVDRWKLCDKDGKRAYLYKDHEKVLLMMGSSEVFCCKTVDGTLEKMDIPNGTILYTGHDIEQERLVVINKTGMFLWFPSSRAYDEIPVPWIHILLESTRFTHMEPQDRIIQIGVEA